MMDFFAAIAGLLLVCLWLRRIDTRRTTDDDILAARKRRALEKANEEHGNRIRHAYDHEPHWWVR
jgi:hypothetical protein